MYWLHSRLRRVREIIERLAIVLPVWHYERVMLSLFVTFGTR
jgi:hypothetical protein